MPNMSMEILTVLVVYTYLAVHDFFKPLRQHWVEACWVLKKSCQRRHLLPFCQHGHNDKSGVCRILMAFGVCHKLAGDLDGLGQNMKIST